MRVLVVEDDAELAAVLANGLGAEGFAIELAEDGVEGLWMATENAFDLILLDIMLPKVNGYQICQIIRRNPEYKHIPVVMLSGKDGVFDKVRGKLVGATEYITKPFEPRDLLRVVRKYVPVEAVVREAHNGAVPLGARRVS